MHRRFPGTHNRHPPSRTDAASALPSHRLFTMSSNRGPIRPRQYAQPMSSPDTECLPITTAFRPRLPPRRQFAAPAAFPISRLPPRRRIASKPLPAAASGRAPGAPAGRPVGQGRLELPTSRLSSARSDRLSYWPDRTRPGTARPEPPARNRPVEAAGLEPATRGLQSRRSPAELRPRVPCPLAPAGPPARRLRGRAPARAGGAAVAARRGSAAGGAAPASRPATGALRKGCAGGAGRRGRVLRKEVIQPQVPLRLPCYDFTPVADPTVAGCLPSRGWRAVFGRNRLPWCDGRCVQGPGTYSPRHADPRLLAIPPSRARVAERDPN